jgi:protein-glutamine gamma-glutamyltransferase
MFNPFAKRREKKGHGHSPGPNKPAGERFKFKEVPLLVFASTLLSLYALMDHYLNEPLGLFALALLFIIGAYARRGKALRVPRPLLVMLVLLLVAAMFVAVFVLKVHPEGALVSFLMILVLAKSYTLRKINDYSQLMFLSVLSMMAAGSYNPTHSFTLYVGLYTFLAGYTIYRFHLLTESLAHRRIQKTLPALVLNTGRRGWIRSFLLAAMVTCSIAAVIFSIIPRQTPNWTFSDDYASQQGTLTGFTQEMTLGQMANTLQDKTPVLRVKYLRDENQRSFSRTLYLRGMVLSQYVQFGNVWKWLEDRSGLGETRTLSFPEQSKSIPIQLAKLKPENQALWRICFEKSISTNLFVIDRPVAISVNRPVSLSYDAPANTLSAGSQSPGKGFTYELLTEHVPNLSKPTTRPSTLPLTAYRMIRIVPSRTTASGPYPTLAEATPMKLVAVAAYRPMAQKIIASLPPKASVEDKAARIEAYLRSNFTYTLDNTDVRRSVEPVVDFLTRRKHGHCEYFASAMALLARSLGMNAQIVVGYKGGEYNSFGDYFLVRNLDAHAWVEVYSPTRGWVEYDPTPLARDEFIREQDEKTFKWFWDLVDLLQYSWADKVANYDSKDRKEFMKQLQDKFLGINANLDNKKWSLNAILKRIIDFIKGQDYESVWLQVLHSFVAILVMILVVLLSRIVVVVAGIMWSGSRQYFQRRWEERFGGLWFCPVDFYRRLLLWLATHGITRSGTETAREFAERVGQAYPDVVQPFQMITETYLAVRFGKGGLAPRLRGELSQAADRVQIVIAGSEKMSPGPEADGGNGG